MITSSETATFEERIDAVNASVSVSNSDNGDAEKFVSSEENASTSSSR